MEDRKNDLYSIFNLLPLPSIIYLRLSSIWLMVLAKKIFLLVSLVILFLLTNQFVSAETPTLSPTQNPTTPTPTPTTSQNNGEQDKMNNLQKEIGELQSKISELQKQEKTLSSQIGVMDSQIKLTELRINSTKQKLATLESDIEKTDKKISKLETSLTNITKILLNRIVATYEVGSIQPIGLLVSSNNMSDFFKRASYLKLAQEHDRKLLFNTQQARNDYANQKTIFEDKKQKAVALKKQLEGYTTQLNNEKKDKENLLSVTHNSEKEYQKRLTDAMRELQQIQKAASVLISTEPRHVNKGDVIGLMGNTGYSFGAHLHFGVYNVSSLSDYNYYSSYENPSNVLKSQTVKWGTGCSGDPVGETNTGSGTFDWPMSVNGLSISQGFGMTCYSNVYYRGRPHPAYDMYNNSDITIKAAEEGQAYFCRNCTGDGANGVFLFHPNGKMTLYWHMQ